MVHSLEILDLLKDQERLFANAACLLVFVKQLVMPLDLLVVAAFRDFEAVLVELASISLMFLSFQGLIEIMDYFPLFVLSIQDLKPMFVLLTAYMVY